MSILSQAFDAVVDFFSAGSSTPATPTIISAQQIPAASSGYTWQQGAADAIGLFGPLIKGTVTAASAPKPLPMPEQPTFPRVPDSVRNDPRVKNLLGSYGFPDNMPTIKPQDLSKGRPSAIQSAFQQAFPAMFDTAASIFQRQLSPSVAVQQQQQLAQVTQAALTGTPNPSTPTPNQVAGTAVQTVVKAVDSVTGGAATSMSDAISKFMKFVAPDTSKAEELRMTAKYDPLIESSAQTHGVNPNLIRAVIANESSGNPEAVGDGVDGKPAAYGLGQMQLGTARDAAKRAVTPEELKKPEVSIDLIARHLAKLGKSFGGDYEKVITAWNAGERGTQKGVRVPEYLKKVGGTFAALEVSPGFYKG